ncbi:carbohydrate kinase, FGGY family protein [Leptospira broomii serovar Hurstbridge str. 5399]|uniref:Carbohydrate kinase, FGGY family protein n=1 Tax=Leptospira broomii serovar Hurstbridge str. 5399 TaxID=1049789 RepID=T0FCH9_9LEPT|nr:FGGY-family carbohydrate kinase [Leptospira broomii]EQA45561.1 carbohydrate kinase, FGGY family protein [Leptospira broomii serovar Hurstbridge str. 5399]
MREDSLVHILTYDIGTTGTKTCLFEISNKLKLLHSTSAEYELSILENGGVEQDANEWWKAMCDTTRRLFVETGFDSEKISGISFCSQMQGLVLVDSQLKPLRPAMSYMDQRAKEEMHLGIETGIKIEGLNAFKLLRSLQITGAVAGSVKDPLWKYKWVQAKEPEIFRKVHKWLDVKEYLIARSTGKAVMTADSAFATFLFDSRPGKGRWHKGLCNMFGVKFEHLPEIVSSTDKVGELIPLAASELGLKKGIPVFGGGGDASLIGIGAGAVEEGDTHIYSGTSGWVSTVTRKRKVDINSRIASIVGARPEHYNYFGEQETSGKCLQWVKDHLALDEIDVYLEKRNVTEGADAVHESLFEFLLESIKDTPAGSDGVIFTPWLHGNRCPFEDPLAKGIFFNIGLNTGKRKLIRAVIEGIAFHKRWILELSEKNIPSSKTIRFVGGVARSAIVCQILADITGRIIETTEHPQNAGATGAAAITALGLGKIASFKDIRNLIPVQDRWLPNSANKAVYQKNFEVFRELYKSNQRHFARLNG